MILPRDWTILRAALGSLALGAIVALPAQAVPSATLEPSSTVATPLRLPRPAHPQLAVPLPPERPAEFSAMDSNATGTPLADAASPSTQDRPESFEASLRPAPQHEDAGSIRLGSDATASESAGAAGFQLDTSPHHAAAFVLPPLRPAPMDEDAVQPHLELSSAPLPPVRIGLPDTTVARAILPPPRPDFAFDAEPVETASLPLDEPSAPRARSLFESAEIQATAPTASRPSASPLYQRIAYHAKLNAVPEDLVHRVIIRESKYNPRAVGRGGALGLMQIKHATARGLGYGGTAAGLLDAETNLTYAVKYLAGAYRVAGGDYDRAVRNYARGYYYEAKRQGLLRTAELGRRLKRLRQADATTMMLDGPPGESSRTH